MNTHQPDGSGQTSPVRRVETWLPASVGLEGIGEYRAQITLARWNGFAIPRFDREVMERIVRNQHDLHGEYAAVGLGHIFLDLAWDGNRVLICDRSDMDPEHGTAYIEDVFEPDEEGSHQYDGGFLCWETVFERWENAPATLLNLAASSEAERCYLNRQANADAVAEDCFAEAARAGDEAHYLTVTGFGIPLSSADEAIEFLARAMVDRECYRVRTQAQPQAGTKVQ